MENDETTISQFGVNASPLYRASVDNGVTVIKTYDTGTPMWVINGDIAGGAKPMTTDERTAITPAEGELIYDTDLGSLYIGDGVTQGGVAVGGGGGGGGDYTFSSEFTVTGAGGVSINTISGSKITGAVASASVADALVEGGTVGYAVNAGTATSATNATNATSATSAGSAGHATLAGGLDTGVVVTSATNATNATNATSATNATNATSATNAGYATSAGTAGALATGVIVASASAATTAGTATSATSATYLGGATKAQIIDSAVSSASGGVVGNVATVENVMTGVTGGTQTIVDVDSLRGGLTAGQAVDVTSEPDAFATRASGGGYRDTFTWDFDSYSTFGFESFPKFVAGLKYLMICDVTPSTNMTVMPFGRWIDDGTMTPRMIYSGETTRLAFVFDQADHARLQFTDFFNESATFSNVREYEVTACSDDAIAYIAALSNPDSFQDYYLVKRDMVSPWTYMIDMRSSPATTVAAGLAYQIDCTSGSHIITVDTCPTGFIGRDTFVRLLVGETGGVVVQSPLKLASPLTANAINNCVVQYRDGEAILTLTDIFGGYLVTDATGTTEGSMYYGLTTGYNYITVSPVLDGTPIDLGGATVSVKKTITGNGITSTFLSGSIKPAANTTFSDVSFQNVTILTGGTFSLQKQTAIPAGGSVDCSGTFALSGGTIDGSLITRDVLATITNKIDVTGSGTVSLKSSQFACSGAAAKATFSGITFSGCGSSTAAGNGGVVSLNGGASATFVGCTFSGNQAKNGGVLYNNAGCTARFSSCTITGNTATASLFGYLNKGVTYITDSVIDEGQNMQFAGAGSGWIVFAGSNTLKGAISRIGSTTSGTVLISAGATLNASGVTGTATADFIAPVGGIIVGTGTPTAWTQTGEATFINQGGSAVTLTGSMTSIKKNGTTT